MAIDWLPFVELVQRHESFVLSTHVRPDGDALGSILALGSVLRRLGKKTALTVASTIPPRYFFLDPEQHVRRLSPDDTFAGCDAAVIVDTGTWGQLGDFGPVLRRLTGGKAVIDHHVTQDDLGAVRLVDTSSEAAGRLVYEAIRALGMTPTADEAHCLLVALAMDTGWFRHSNTSPATFELAAELTRLGARPTEAYDQLFEQSSPERLRLTGVVLGRLELAHQGRTCHTTLLASDYASTGATPQDSEDLVNYTRSVKGAEVGLMFLEQPRGGIKVSFRARALDVASIAERFGGGGHRLAAGATINASVAEARERVLAAVGAALGALPT
jgi:phosphoesterase RecJ-like protein